MQRERESATLATAPSPEDFTLPVNVKFHFHVLRANDFIALRCTAHRFSCPAPRPPSTWSPPASGLVSAWRSASNGLVIIINGKTFSNLKLSNLILSPGHKPAAPSLPPSTHTHNGFALIVLGHSRLAVPFMAIVPALQRQRPLRRRLCGWLHQLSRRHTWRMSDKAAAAAGAAAAATRW